MDAHALLTSQGWRGSGHSLHPTSDNTGLSRPLLVSRKQNTLGVGKKQHRTSDMWWMNAFDKSLKGLDTAEKGKVVQTVTNGGLDMVAKGGSKFVGNGGLYASFVRGESLSGTITPKDGEQIHAGKRKRGEVIVETKEERRARKAAKHAARARSLLGNKPVAPAVIDNADNEAIEGLESMEQCQERREQRRLLHRIQENASSVAGADEKPRKKKRRKDKDLS